MHIREYGHFRTVCIECLHRCEEFNSYYAKTHPRAHAKVSQELTRNKPNISESTSRIIKLWINSSRSLK